LTPFLRSNPAKKGYNCTLDKFPEYIEETEVEKAPVQKEGIWRYNHKDLSQPTRALGNNNSQLRVIRHRQKV